MGFCIKVNRAPHQLINTAEGVTVERFACTNILHDSNSNCKETTIPKEHICSDSYVPDVRRKHRKGHQIFISSKNNILHSKLTI